MILEIKSGTNKERTDHTKKSCFEISSKTIKKQDIDYLLTSIELIIYAILDNGKTRGNICRNEKETFNFP